MPASPLHRAVLVAAACVLTGCGGSASTAQTTTVQRPAPRPAALWGLDSNSAQTAASLDAAKARYGADPAFIGRYITTGGGPAPLTRSEVDLFADRAPRPIPILLIADIYARCTADAGLGLTETGMGEREADQAADAAQALGVPADDTIVVIEDLEAVRPATAPCIAAYADEITRRGYQPGWYGNPLRGNFGAAFCTAAQNNLNVAGGLIWSSQRLAGASGPAGAPAFAPARPPCPQGHTVLWQYSRDEIIGGVGFDTNELSPPSLRRHLWHP